MIVPYKVNVTLPTAIERGVDLIQTMHGCVCPKVKDMGPFSASGQLINELFPDCLKVKLFALVLRHRGGDRIHEMRCLFVAVGPNARFIVLPHWNNMSYAHMPHAT